MMEFTVQPIKEQIIHVIIMVDDQVENLRFFVGATECLEEAKVSYIRAQHVFLFYFYW